MTLTFLGPDPYPLKALPPIELKDRTDALWANLVEGKKTDPAPAEETPSEIDRILNERETRYGDFWTHAKIAQELKRAMAGTPNWKHLSDSQRECLEMVAHKIGRILNGDPEYLDSWVDCIGYLTLVTKELEK